MRGDHQMILRVTQGARQAADHRGTEAQQFVMRIEHETDDIGTPRAQVPRRAIGLVADLARDPLDALPRFQRDLRCIEQCARTVVTARPVISAIVRNVGRSDRRAMSSPPGCLCTALDGAGFAKNRNFNRYKFMFTGRKAEKRELMGLPPLEPYYCKNFGRKDTQVSFLLNQLYR